MITYNPKDWLRLIFMFHRSDSFRILLPAMFILGACTAGLVYIEIQTHIITRSSTVFHQILGFVLSMLLVFRINTAYERWWEGRKLWGSLINNSRSLAAKISAMTGTSARVETRMILQIIATFPACLRDHLRGIEPTTLPEIDNLTAQEFADAPNRPFFLYQKLQHLIEKLRSSGTLSTEQLLLINSEVFSLIDITGACERIKKSPIPFSYSLFLKKIIFVYVITMPFPFSIEFGYWSTLAVVIIFYGFASLEIISEEIEDPFGEDANDLPLDELAERIRSDVTSLIPA